MTVEIEAPGEAWWHTYTYTHCDGDAAS